MSNTATLNGTLADLQLESAAVDVVFTLTAPVKVGAEVVFASRKEITPDEDGSFSIQLVPGSYSMAITPDGGSTSTLTFTIPDADTYDLVDLVELPTQDSTDVIYVRVDAEGRLILPTSVDFFAANKDALCAAVATCDVASGSRIRNEDDGLFYELLCRVLDGVNTWDFADTASQGDFQDAFAQNDDDQLYYKVTFRTENGVRLLQIADVSGEPSFTPTLARSVTNSNKLYELRCVTENGVNVPYLNDN